MPGRDRKIDNTGDYISDGKGSYVMTTTLETAIWHQIQGELDHWVGDPTAGSDFFRLARAGNSQKTSMRATDMVKRAMKPFLDLGLAAQLEVVTSRDVAGRFGISSSIHDLQHGTLDITGLLPGGP